MKFNSKKKTTAILTIVLALVIAVGSTLAYLATTTDEKENVFSFGENIKARLDEPNWKPTDGEDLVPGSVIRKDPMITNVSDNGLDQFVAIKVTFADGTGVKLSDADALKLLKLITIDWNTTDWELMEGVLDVAGDDVTAEQMWVYTKEIIPGEVTTPIFNTVTINEDISDEDFEWLAGVIMTHTDGCYKYGVCTCTDPALRHHINCASLVTDDPDDCDCEPVTIHESDCPAIIGKIDSALCKCDPPLGSIGGFTIKVQGAAVQAFVDGMISYDAPATIDALKALLF